MPKQIPSPRAMPFIGNLLDVISDDVPTRALERMADEYGPIYKLTIKGVDRIIVANHALFSELCDETRFCKTAGPGLAALNRGKGPPGLFTASSEKDPDWAQAHRILMPAFGPMSVRNMFVEMHDIASQLVLKWARKGPEYKIPVTEEFTRLTLDTIALCAMDFRFNSFYQEEMHPFVATMNNVLTAGIARARLPGLVQKLMFSANEQLKADNQYMQKVAMELVELRRQNPTDKKDLLNAMIHGKDPKTGEGMRDQLIASNMVTFLIAGHETTSGLLSFAFCNLLKNPATYFKAREEIDRVIGQNKITVDHLKDLEYINAVLRETLRLAPTAPAVTRIVRDENKEDPPTLGNGEYILKRDWAIMGLLPKIHRDPAVYGEDANLFKPERMLDESFENLPKGAWQPFGTGLRACIGRPFAWQESLLVMAILLQNFDFSLDDPSYELQIKSTMTIKPKDFYMRACLRKGVTATTLQHRLASSGDLNDIKLSHTEPETVNGSFGKHMTVLYGSNTGTCQSFAQKLASDTQVHGYTATVKELDTAVNALPQDQPVVIITASYEGLPPDNAAQFVAWLESMKSNRALEGVTYAVFGCGHKDWRSTYHRIPQLIDEAFEKLGAKRIISRGSSDASHGDMFSDFDNWSDSAFWPAIKSQFGSQTENDVNSKPEVEMEISTNRRAAQLQQHVQQGTVVAAQLLTTPGEPEKRHLEIKLPDGMEYEAGDYLSVLPMNPDENVRRVLSRYSLAWDAVVTVKSGGPVHLPTNKPVSAFDLLKGFVELSHPATKKNIQTCIDSTAESSTQKKLELLVGPTYQSEILPKRTSILDLLELHPEINLPFPSFIAMLPPMRHRHYSISSSPLHNPSSCTITYGVLNTPSLSGVGNFIGVSGSYLRSLRPGDAIQISIRKAAATFHLPPSSSPTPIIMFCNGTGLAPFRAFVQERATQLKSNPQQTLAPAILFVGCRSKDTDCLYSKEFAEWQKLGAVDVRYGFSREPEHPDAGGCKYVQDRLMRDRKDIFELWGQGAKIFLCGSPSMVEGVRKVARELVEERAKEMGLVATEEQIGKWLDGMRNERIAVDVYA